jgi:hypothetical protein
VLLWGASGVTSKIVSVAINQEIWSPSSFFYGWIRTFWFWGVTALLTVAGILLVWPSVQQLWLTGHTTTHWSRFVVAINCFSFAAILSLLRVIDWLLDLVDVRVRYLTKSHE